ncbi:MAG: hypothetical protein QGG80_05310 [Candidatus Krumholzibacteria bacterium]|jgi:phosphatidate cytidylyltransferase|nr:hypothetical protein [Candidatus Krumholzibacteria bacterium]MDP6796443.1 hypothetical protein [Candidatus Krumholzibacteria bacterium]MDP7022450.1 hypothetical protein [Candidatus Krumholzibacteria bacterium]
MLDPVPDFTSLAVLAALSLILVLAPVLRNRLSVPTLFRYLWVLVLALLLMEQVGLFWGLLVFAFLSFGTLREYLSLLEIRREDRWGILLCYLSIPFQFFLIGIDWYGMFIISIPVYTFLFLPWLVALGGRSRGMVFSVGALDFGLFLFVFSLGHLAYLARFSVRMALLGILAVALADLLGRLLSHRNRITAYLAGAAGALLLLGLGSPWSGIPLKHSLSLALLLPLFVLTGQFTLDALGKDLGIRPDRLEAGRGRALDALKAQLFAAPILFHYLRWFLHWGDL